MAKLLCTEKEQILCGAEARRRRHADAWQDGATKESVQNLPFTAHVFLCGVGQRVLLFLRPQGALYYPPHRVGDAGKGDILFLEREYPPYTPKRKDEGSPPRPPTLAVCSLNNCTRCAVWVRCTWLRHESSAIRYQSQPRLTIVRRE